MKGVAVQLTQSQYIPFVEIHLEVVAAQHDTHDVLADVVHIALHSGHDDDTCKAVKNA